MNISTAPGCILLFFVFCFLILPSSSTGAIPTLNHLGAYSQFYDSMLLPLVKECSAKGSHWDHKFGVNDRFSLGGEVKLCKYVRKLNKLFTNLDIQNQMPKGGKRKRNKHEENVDNIPQQIHDHILKHNNSLRDHCSTGWTNLHIDNVEYKLPKIDATKEDLSNELKEKFEKAFKEKFWLLIKELEKKKNAGKIEELSREIAYGLLFIGNEMEKVFKVNEKERMECAFKLFAAQLAVYSLRLDKLPTSAHKKGAIQAIAQSWPGMTLETEKPAADAGEPSGME